MPNLQIWYPELRYNVNWWIPASESESWALEASPPMSLFNAAWNASTSAPECIVSSCGHQNTMMVQARPQLKISRCFLEIYSREENLIIFKKLDYRWVHSSTLFFRCSFKPTAISGRASLKSSGGQQKKTIIWKSNMIIISYKKKLYKSTNLLKEAEQIKRTDLKEKRRVNDTVTQSKKQLKWIHVEWLLLLYDFITGPC